MASLIFPVETIGNYPGKLQPPAVILFDFSAIFAFFCLANNELQLM